MSKQLQGSPSSKSLKSRMGTIMRRSSTALGGLARPGTSSRSSTESLRLEASAAGPEHVMPSPVAESPAREAAESMPEPTGPSRLSGPAIAAPDPTSEPTATVSSTPEPAVPASVPQSSSIALYTLNQFQPSLPTPHPISRNLQNPLVVLNQRARTKLYQFGSPKIPAASDRLDRLSTEFQPPLWQRRLSLSM